MRTRFITEHFEGDSTTVNVKYTLETRGVSLEELCESFEDFLRGSGFHFNGNVVIIADDEKVTK